MNNSLLSVLSALKHVTHFIPQRSGAEYKSRCPAHEDSTPSLTISEGSGGKVLLHCHAGCSYESIVAKLGITPEPAQGESRRIIATYAYTDESGTEVRQKLRYEPKDFRIRHRDESGAWVYKSGPGPAVLYRSPDLQQAIAQGATVFLVEGEKDADRLAALGGVATTNIEGASKTGQKPKWRKEYTAQLAGAARVILLPDHDDPGRAHMQAIAQALRPVVADVRIVELPGLPDKGDVSDWLNGGHTLAELLALVEQTPVPEGHEPPTVEAAPSREPTSKKTLGTVVEILSTTQWKGVIGFNSFHQAIEKRTATPYGGTAGAWRDCDTAETMLLLESTTGVAFGRDLVDLAVMAVAHRNTFNPAQDRLRMLADQWDGTARLNSWLTDYLNAKTNDSNREYLEEIGPAWLKGVAARVLLPGCKRDDVLVLRGSQGWRKSTAAQCIADCIHPDSFTDSIDLNNLAEAKIQIRGVIIAELAELAGMAKAEVEAVKAFVTTRSDHFREKFGRYAEDFPRTVSFIGSTNDPNFLKDPTGNRRYWPVTLAAPIDTTALEQALPQLIGEAARRVLNGEPWHVTADKALEQADQVRSAHFDEDVWTDPVMRLVEGMNAAGTFITTAEILDGLQIPRVQQTPNTKQRVAAILKVNHYEEARRWLDKKNNVNQRYWKFTNARSMVPTVPNGSSSEIQGKTGNHWGTIESPSTVPNLPPKVMNGNHWNITSGSPPVPDFSQSNSGGTVGTIGNHCPIYGENYQDTKRDADTLVDKLLNGSKGRDTAALKTLLGWYNDRWEAARDEAVGAGRIWFTDGGWYAKEVKP